MYRAALSQRMKTTFDAGLLISLDRKSVVPLRQQIERAIRSAVRSGRVSEGEFLPASRTLASRLTVGRGVVVEAYEQLAAEGYLVTQSGSGTRVSSVGARSQPQDELPLRSRWWPQYDFRPGMPDLQTFPKREWLACLKKALALPSRETLGYPDPAGPLTTREALAGYLARSRATIGGSGRIVLCNGFTQGIDLVARLLKAAGVTCVAVEDPGFDGLMALFSSLNIETTRVPVDEQGLVVEMLARTQAGAVLVTPAHQYPSGIGLAPGRRAELIRWAYRRNALIIEDDYDAEFRYDRQPVGSLQGLAPERVMYIGTTSKTLSPALRLGWILSPVEHVNTLSRLKRRSDRGSATLDQLALAAFLGDGTWTGT